MLSKEDFMLCDEVDFKDFKKQGYDFEVKFDGVRGFAVIEKGRVVKLLNRSGINRLEDRFAQFKEDTFNDYDIIFDGEIVVFDDELRTRLPLVSSRDNWKKAKFVVFDVISVNGNDVRDYTLVDRRKLLKDLFYNFTKKPKNFALSPVFEGLNQIWGIVKERDLEGVIAKKLNSKYFGKRCDYWIKIKNWKYVLKKVEKYEITENKGFVIYVKLDNGNLQKVVVNGKEESKIIKDKIDSGIETIVELRYLHEEDKGLRELVFSKLVM
jgi:ATP-dependent DNA ligase